jgi:serine/threonine-protein kinase
MLLEANVVIADRFRLIRQLGQGGMGSVWLATHLALDIPCAVKFIEGEIAQLPEAQARFEREAKAAAALRSPNVVQILDHGVFQGTPYIAMELLDGEDFGKRLAKLGRMQPVDVIRIITQVCRALGKAHAAGIIHRDLKPDNIYLVPDDDREIAKVLDFGIAKTSGGIDGSNTKTGAMLGTPYYMSPEQAQGTRAVDARSDLWSLAVIAFQALSGKLPFESEALGDLLVKIIVAPIPSPREFAPDLPPSFEAWWQRASQRDPAQRFQSARELAESLALAFGQSQGIGGESGAYRPPQISTAEGGIPMNTPQGMAQSTGGYRAVTGAAMAGTQVGMGPTTGATMSRTFDGPGSDALPKKKNNLAVALGGGAALLLVLGIGGVSMMKSKSDAPAPVAAAATVPPPQPTAVVPATPQPPPAPPPATAVALPPEAPATAVAPEKSAAATAPAVTTTAAAQPAVHHVQAMPASPPPAAKPAAAPTKKAAVDLGI